MRARGWWAGAVLLLATACATEQEEALQRVVDEARERNAVIGGAIGLLLTLAIRHVVYARRADREARARAAGYPPPAYRGRGAAPRLVAAAAATEVACDLVLLAGGATVGWLFGPTPYDDQTFDGEIAFAVVLVFVLPILGALAALAMIVQGTAARLPDVGTGTLVFYGALHAALVAYGVSELVTDGAGLWGGLVPAVVGLIGAGGFWYEAYARRRDRAAAPHG